MKSQCHNKGSQATAPHNLLSMARSATLSRTTKETEITVTWDLDGTIPTSISSGIGFLDHMLEALAKHSGTSLQVACKGDLHIDGHHTTEDIAITMGKVFAEAIGDKVGIERFGFMQAPLDEALIAATIDISGRGYCVCNVHPPAPMIGDFDTELVHEFFASLAGNAQICLHLHQICGANSHHIVEASFKAMARALKQAIAVTGTDIPSTKGTLSD